MFTAIALICVIGVEPEYSKCAVTTNTEYFYATTDECHQAIELLSAKGAFDALIIDEKTYLADYVCLEWFGVI